MEILIYLLTCLVGCSITFLIFWRYCYFLKIKALYKLIFSLLSIIIGCIPLLIIKCKIEFLLGDFFKFYCHSLYFLFVFEIILLTLTIPRDILWSIIYKIPIIISKKNIISSPFSYSVLLKINFITVILALTISIHALFEGLRTPRIKNVEIYSKKIYNKQKVVLLSDLHISRITSSDKIKGIVNSVNIQNPDIILLAGDIIDDDFNLIKNLINLLGNLTAKYGVYFVTGNHELYLGLSKSVSILKTLGFIHLKNNGISINNQLYIAGIPDISSYKGHIVEINIDEALKNSRENQFRLLVSHTPYNIKRKNKVDLEVAGHTHGGQIFPFHIFSYLYNAYFVGLYTIENEAQIYVSRGSGQWGPQMRFLAPSEITVLTLMNNVRVAVNK